MRSSASWVSSEGAGLAAGASATGAAGSGEGLRASTGTAPSPASLLSSAAGPAGSAGEGGGSKWQVEAAVDTQEAAVDTPRPRRIARVPRAIPLTAGAGLRLELGNRGGQLALVHVIRILQEGV